MESHRQIEDQAAEYLAKRDSGEWTDADQVELEHWMAESTAHRVALLRLEGVWDEARRLKALTAGLQRGAVPPPGHWQQSPFFDTDSEASTQHGVNALPLATPPVSPPESHHTVRKFRVYAVAATLLMALGVGLQCGRRGHCRSEARAGGSRRRPQLASGVPDISRHIARGCGRRIQPLQPPQDHDRRSQRCGDPDQRYLPRAQLRGIRPRAR